MRWIELTCSYEDTPILINQNMITDISPRTDEPSLGSRIYVMNKPSAIHVKETYDYIVDKVYSGRDFND